MANTTPSTRKTKRDFFNEILAIPMLNDEQKNFIQHEIELLNKKNGTERKPTKTQLENEGYKIEILEVLKCLKEPSTIAGIQSCSVVLGEMNSQKITALLTQLVKAEKVVRTEVKGKAHFALPAED